MVMASLTSQVEQVINDNAGAEPSEVAAKVAAAIGAPDNETAGFLWRALVVGLVGILAISLLGIVIAVLDGKTATSPDTLLTIFSSALTGLIGLFVTK
jgi:hypothetical protein